MNKLMIRFGGVLASLALMVSAMEINSTCIFAAYQPELPKGAQRLRKCQ